MEGKIRRAVLDRTITSGKLLGILRMPPIVFSREGSNSQTTPMTPPTERSRIPQIFGNTKFDDSVQTPLWNKSLRLKSRVFLNSAFHMNPLTPLWQKTNLRNRWDVLGGGIYSYALSQSIAFRFRFRFEIFGYRWQSHIFLKSASHKTPAAPDEGVKFKKINEMSWEGPILFLSDQVNSVSIQNVWLHRWRRNFS